MLQINVHKLYRINLFYVKPVLKQNWFFLPRNFLINRIYSTKFPQINLPESPWTDDALFMRSYF